MGDHIPVRKPVTRSGVGMRVKVASRKTKLTIQCESLLEADAVRVLDSHPHVAGVYEQPEIVEFHDDQNQVRKTFPDFSVVLTDGRELLLEVKRAKKARMPREAQRLDSIHRTLARRSRHFRVWTEAEIYREPRFSTITAIRSCSKTRLSAEARAVALEQIAANPPSCFGALVDLVGRHEAFQLLASHTVFLDLNEPLTSESKIYLKPPAGGANDQI